MTSQEIAAVVLTALLGSGGAVGLLFWAVKRQVERRSAKRTEEESKKEDTRKNINYLVEHGQEVDRRLADMAQENTLQCYCLLACLRGLAEQGCNGPVHDGINRLEKYLNQKAHGERP